MGCRGWGRRGVALGLVAAAASLAAAAAKAEGFSAVGGLHDARMSAASAPLSDGSVLVASEDGIERYDPAGRDFSLVANLPANHGFGLTATLLNDGRVLFVGGQYGDASVGNAEIYDPATRTVTSTGGLSTPRSYHTATLLPDGRVLVTGGHRWNSHTSALATAEVYDPTTHAFSPAGDMASARQDATATGLPGGRVLVAGGYRSTDGLAHASAELFDPTTNSFTPAGDMEAGRANHTATALADGKVLIIGGHAFHGGPSLSSAEIYDPSVGTFSPAGDMTSPRGAHTATLLADGRVFVAGGFTAFPLAPTLGTAEIWDPETGVFVEGAHGMREPRGRHVAAALAGGAVLAAGGLGQDGSILPSAEVYSPSYVDVESPVIYGTQDFTVAATAFDPSGEYVYYYPWATDDSDVNPLVTCQPPSGSFLLVGATFVTCSATDSWGNTANASFRVTVLEPLAMILSIDAFGTVESKTGVAVVSGTLSCNRPASAGVSGQLTQLGRSRPAPQASFLVYGPCGQGATPWTATVAAQRGRFASGKADLVANASAFDNYSTASAATRLKIQLREEGSRPGGPPRGGPPRASRR